MEWPPVVSARRVVLGVDRNRHVELSLPFDRAGVNAASPADRRVGFWMMGLKSWGILKRHRELFPESKKRYKMRWMGAIFLCAAVIIGGTFAVNAGSIKS
jgi:hypothetical protein